MESRRIIRNRKMFILISILLLFNGCWYLYQQHSKWKNYDLSMTQVSGIQQNYLLATSDLNKIQTNAFFLHKKEQLDRKIDKLINQDGFSMNNTYKLVGEKKIISDLEEQFKHIESYHKKIDDISKRATLMSSISIFQVEDSFSQKNIVKPDRKSVV